VKAVALKGTPEKTKQFRLAVPDRLDASGRAALRLQLSRFPSPDESSILELIAAGFLRLPMLVTAIGDNATYFRSARFSLFVEGRRVASADGRGESPTTCITTPLDQLAAREILLAFSGQRSRMQLECDMKFALPSGRGRDGTEVVKSNLSDILEFEESLDTYVTLEAPDPRTGTLVMVPTRLQLLDYRDIAVDHGMADVVPTPRGFATLASAAATSRIQDANSVALAANLHASHPISAAVSTNVAWLADQTIIATQPSVTHLPKIDDDTQDLFPDYADASRYWYVPTFMLLQPNPALGIQSSPFSFRFKQVGHTANLGAGINATLTFTLQQRMSDAAAAKLAALGNPSAQAIPFTNFAVSLVIPFRDKDGKMQHETFPVEISPSGQQMTGSVSLVDDAARLAYGAIAIKDFQPEAAKIRVDAFFEAMVPTGIRRWPVSFEGKIDRLPAVSVAKSPDVATPARAVATQEGATFTREAPRSRTDKVPVSAQWLVARPQLHNQVVIATAGQTVYGLRNVARSWELDCLFPCQTLGAFYLQEVDGLDVAVGCQDALKLGDIDYKQYSRLEDPAIPASAMVYRSTLQPGRFLLVPAAYKVTRFGKDAGDKAFRPAAFLYSSLDADNPDSNKCVLMATLGPDVSASEVERLRELLRKWSPKPVIDILTSLDADTSYTWLLSSATTVRDTQVIRRWDSFQVAFSMDLEQAPIVESMLAASGIQGSVKFTLPDKSSLESNLSLDLNSIVGPADTGPVAVERVGGILKLTNQINAPVDVDDLLCVNDAAVPGTSSILTVPVEKTLQQNESFEVTPSEPIPNDRRIVPVAIPKPGSAETLTEIRSFVEDIYAEVAFTNLINYGNHSLAAIGVTARVKDAVGTYQIASSEAQPVSVIQIVLPLTKYLANPVLQFQASLTKNGGNVVETAWIDWPFQSKGNVVALTWELFGNPW